MVKLASGEQHVVQLTVVDLNIIEVTHHEIAVHNLDRFEGIVFPESVLQIRRFYVNITELAVFSFEQIPFHQGEISIKDFGIQDNGSAQPAFSPERCGRRVFLLHYRILVRPYHHLPRE